MLNANADLLGTWNVAFNQYRWTYVFTDDGKVTWRDKFNGKTGAGKWTNTGTAVTIAWDKSTARETWNLPIHPEKQMGQMKSDQTSGWFEAVKEQDKTHSYDGYAPEGQSDTQSCWAACLAWYSKVVPNAPTRTQESFLMSGVGERVKANGSITKLGLMAMEQPGPMMQRGGISPAAFEELVRGGKLPMVVAFLGNPAGEGGHVNVIHSYDPKDQTVGVMEPWFPDPEKNSAYEFLDEIYIHKKTRQTFKFTGGMLRRSLSFYSSKPIEGQIIVLAPA